MSLQPINIGKRKKKKKKEISPTINVSLITWIRIEIRDSIAKKLENRELVAVCLESSREKLRGNFWKFINPF